MEKNDAPNAIFRESPLKFSGELRAGLKNELIP